jgi:hypothetical protein
MMSGECFAESINRARPDVAKHDANCANAQGEQRPLRGMTCMVILFAMTKIVCGLRSNHFVSPAFAPNAPKSSQDARISMATNPSQQSNKAGHL